MRKLLAVVLVLAVLGGGGLALVLFVGAGLRARPQAWCQPGGAGVVVAGVPGGEVAGYAGEQLQNAATIVRVGEELGFDPWGQTIGVMTAMGESSLRNLPVGDDLHGVTNPDGTPTSSLGLFQQQDWWGSRADRLAPARAAALFFEALDEVPGWRDLEPTIAAHRVQRNADPHHYARYWDDAVAVVAALAAGDATTPPAAAAPAATAAPAAHAAAGGIPAPAPGGSAAAPDGAAPGEPTDAATPTQPGSYDLGPVAPHTAALAEEIGRRFGVAEVGGYRETAIDSGGHPAGLAVDFMTHDDVAKGDAIVAYAVEHAARLGVDYIIWRQRIWFAADPQAGWQPMADRGSPTANHLDHPHINLSPVPGPGAGALTCLLASSVQPAALGTGQWVAPVDAPVTSPYGPREAHGGAFHIGTDVAAACGTPIYAAAEGVVTYAAGPHRGLTGSVVFVDHGGGIETSYNHMERGGVLVRPGDRVAAGQVIALVGNDGNSTGCHLHFGVYADGRHTDPEPFMAAAGAPLG
ncbi:M23 family metallopeptidase [Georgenia sp. AZ-5]|uniref:M23 family metallopeptidase n=1 Tax=Georgenia sp. AZ-5 TaxID=3367526 RepID=UPI003754F1A4